MFRPRCPGDINSYYNVYLDRLNWMEIPPPDIYTNHHHHIAMQCSTIGSGKHLLNRFIVKLREREGKRVDLGRLLKGLL